VGDDLRPGYEHQRTRSSDNCTNWLSGVWVPLPTLPRSFLVRLAPSGQIDGVVERSERDLDLAHGHLLALGGADVPALGKCVERH
jgi:hypothetical protein